MSDDKKKPAKPNEQYMSAREKRLRQQLAAQDAADKPKIEAELDKIARINAGLEPMPPADEQKRARRKLLLLGGKPDRLTELYEQEKAKEAKAAKASQTKPCPSDRRFNRMRGRKPPPESLN